MAEDQASNPQADLDILHAEARREARRVEREKAKDSAAVAEAEAAAIAAEANRKAAEAKAKAEIATAKAALRPEVAKRREQIVRLCIPLRERAKKIRAHADALDALAGDVEGCVSTAGQVGHDDPQRALVLLSRAETTFNQRAEQLVNPPR